METEIKTLGHITLELYNTYDIMSEVPTCRGPTHMRPRALRPTPRPLPARPRARHSRAQLGAEAAMALRTVAGSKDIASRGPATRQKGAVSARMGRPKVGCRAGLIPSGAPGCWSSRCQRTCGGGDAQRTLAVTARRARSQGNGHTSGRKQQQSSRRSEGERGEQPNDRLEGRRPPSSTHSQGPAKLTRGDRVSKEN